MTVKTSFTRAEFEDILAPYDLGTLMHANALAQGTVQTNYVIQTTQGQYVFRYYENRSREAVLFESELLAHLTARRYPCPAPIAARTGDIVGMVRGKPYMLFEFVDGQHVEQPNARQQQQLIQKAAELQCVTRDFQSAYTAQRMNYDADLCRALAHDAATQINTPDAHDKFAWLTRELTTLDLPPTVPKGICHCDFHFSNVLFQGDEFVALLDFDDANYTYATFDLVGLLEYGCWPHDADLLDLKRAHAIVEMYAQHRALPPIEQHHLYDVYRLSILFDAVWYFGRETVPGCREWRKIDALTALGREAFKAALFD